MSDTELQTLEQPIEQSVAAAPRLTHAPLSSEAKDYQSKLFNVNAVVNPLIAAAAPLLSFASRIAQLNTAPDLHQLLDDLHYEITVFENKAFRCGYLSQTILAARYLLCSLLDEQVLLTHWGKHSSWREHNCLLTFQREAWGGERFFLILERASEDPTVYIDLLELGYLCLSLGYIGKYVTHKYQLTELNTFTENLYELTRQHRGEFSRRLLITSKQENSKKTHWRLPSRWASALGGLAILCCVFLPYYVHLEQYEQQIVNEMIPTITQNSTNG